MAGPGNILIKVGADAGQAVRELSTVNGALSDTMTHSEKMSAGLKKAALPAAAALGAIGFAALGAAKAAAEDAAAQDHLAGMLERTTGATAEQLKANEDWIASVSRSTGVADDELRPALEKLAGATGDITKAQADLKAAMDISAASGKDLQTVSAAIAKAHTGSTAALSKLIPGLSEASKKSKDFTTIMEELQQKTGGAAGQAAETSAGQFKVFSNQMAELQETLGAALLPVLAAVMPILQHLGDIAANNATAIQILVGVVAALAAGILIANAALKAYEAVTIIVKAATAAWTAAQWLLNAALDANPIGLVALALAGLVTALVIAYKKSETFRDIVDAALNVVKGTVEGLASAFSGIYNAAKTAFDWIVAHWQIALFAFGPIGVAISLIITHFDELKAAALVVKDVVVGVFDAIWGAISRVAQAIGDLVEAIKNIPSHIHLPDLPGPLMAPAPAIASASLRRGGRGVTVSPSGGLVINVYGAVDPEGTARAIRRILSSSDRRLGR